jgi:hypothetical protein
MAPSARRIALCVAVPLAALALLCAFAVNTGLGPVVPTSASAAAERAALLLRIHELELELSVARTSGADHECSPCTRSERSGAQAPSLVERQIAVSQARAQQDGGASVVGFWTQRSATYPASSPPTFKQISDRHRDDKSFKHQYDVPYSLYLEPLRALSRSLSMFEIGLGCDQERIGASVMMWGEYLPDARLTLFEFDEPCGRKWHKENAQLAPKGGFNLYFGDQANAEHLEKAIRDDGDRQYDVIIDDGGHTMQQQLTSFRVLWPRVKRGGVYVVEDLNTSFKSRYGGTRRQQGQGSSGTPAATMTNFMKELMDQVHALPVPHHAGKLIEDTEFKSPFARVDCHHFICFITKR